MKVYELKKVKGWSETIHHAHVSVEDSYSVDDEGKDLSGSYVRLEDVKEMIRKEIPQNWLDPLLTGKEAVIGDYPYHGTDIERLLSAIQSRMLEKFNKDKLKE